MHNLIQCQKQKLINFELHFLTKFLTFLILVSEDKIASFDIRDPPCDFFEKIFPSIWHKNSIGNLQKSQTNLRLGITDFERTEHTRQNNDTSLFLNSIEDRNEISWIINNYNC